MRGAHCGCKACFCLVMASRFSSSPTTFNFAGLAPPSRYFAFASPKESTQRKGDPQRVEFPPQPCHPGRGRNLRRANVAPLQTADRLTPWAARLCRLALTGPGCVEFVVSTSQRLRRYPAHPISTAVLASSGEQVINDAFCFSKINHRTNAPTWPRQACRRVAGARF